MDDQTVIDEFHKLWRTRIINDKLTFMGVQACKTPMDLWVYQEILWELKPETVIECGTYAGGTAHYLACILGIIGLGRVVTIDFREFIQRPSHPRLTYIYGSTTEEGYRKVKSYLEPCTPTGPVLVILDSGHDKDHVLKEMKLYGELVTPGSYMIVEDSDLNGHPTGNQHYWPLGTPGPHEAIEEFLKTHDEFEIDKSREKFLVTVCKDGFLKRVK